LALPPVSSYPYFIEYTAKVWDSKYPVADTTYATARVYWDPELVVSADFDANVCDTAVTQIFAFATGGVKFPADADNPGGPHYHYLWSPTTTFEPNTPPAWTIWNPKSVAHNTTTYTVTVTDALGFTDVDNVTITTHSGYPNVDIHPNAATICTGDTVRLTATGGSTYNWTVYPNIPGNAIIGSTTSPSILVAPVTNGVKYTCTINSDCGIASDFVIITINQRPVVHLADFNPAGYCEYDDINVTLTGGTPLGGTYYIDGVPATSFNPTALSVGIHYVKYVYINYAVNSCPNWEIKTFTIYPRPSMVFNLPNAQRWVCENAPSFTLTGGLPLGGTYSVDGVASNVFNPSVAVPGDHIIQYCYNSHLTANGCIDCRYDTVTVYALPQVGLTLNEEFCIDAENFELTGGTPPGGTYSGDGVYNGFFNPAVAGVGDHIITYTYAEPHPPLGPTCTKSVSTGHIRVWPLPEILSQLANDTICEGSCVDRTIELSGTGPWTIGWTANGVAQTAMEVTSSPYTFTVCPTQSTDYVLNYIQDDHNCDMEQNVTFHRT